MRQPELPLHLSFTGCLMY